LLSCLTFVLDPQLLGIAIAGAHEGGSDTLTARVSLEITLMFFGQQRNVQYANSGLHEASSFCIARKPWTVCRGTPSQGGKRQPIGFRTKLCILLRGT